MKFIGYTLLGCIVVVWVNIFAIQRDQKAFNGVTSNCKDRTWHPNCSVK